MYDKINNHYKVKAFGFSLLPEADESEIKIEKIGNNFLIGETILVQSDMFNKTELMFANVKCKKLNQNKDIATFKCKNIKYSDSINYTFSKTKGITSMRRLCKDCKESNDENLVGEFGIAMPCDQK